MKKTTIKRKITNITTRKKKVRRVPRGHVRPNLDSLLNPEEEDDPFADVEYTDDMEQDAKVEISEALKAIKEEKKRRREAFRIIVDPEFWFAVCFQSREQKEEFLKLVDWYRLGDKYLDGLELAELLDVDIEPIPLKAANLPKAAAGLRKHGLIRNGPYIPEGGDG